MKGQEHQTSTWKMSAFLDAYAEAWNHHDVDAILAAMTADCVMETSTGPTRAGGRYVGQDEVRAGIEDFFSAYPDASWNEPRHFVAGDRAVTEWIFRGTHMTGGPTEAQGCDVFTLRDGKIALKSSYRKQRTR